MPTGHGPNGVADAITNPLVKLESSVATTLFGVKLKPLKQYAPAPARETLPADRATICTTLASESALRRQPVVAALAGDAVERWEVEVVVQGGAPDAEGAGDLAHGHVAALAHG